MAASRWLTKWSWRTCDSATPNAPAISASSATSSMVALRDVQRGTEAAGSVLFLGESLDEGPVRSGGQRPYRLSGVGCGQPAERRPGREIEEGLFDRGDPAGGECSVDPFEVQSAGVPFDKDHPSVPGVQSGALLGHRNDRHRHRPRDRTMVMGCADADQCGPVGAVVSLGETQGGGVKIREPAVIAPPFLWDEHSTRLPRRASAGGIATAALAISTTFVGFEPTLIILIRRWLVGTAVSCRPHRRKTVRGRRFDAGTG